MKVSDLAMPPSVFKGGNGDLVICQEWPHIDGEHYTRVIVPMRDALKLAHAIIDVARRETA
jgi:hypothetical protein